MKVAFLGLGIMGSRMAHNLIKADYYVTVWNRSPEKAQALVKAGAIQASSPAEAVAEADVCITMLSTPEVVREVALGEDGFLAKMAPGSIWLDSSTINPSFAKTMASAASSHNVTYLEAPVAGTKGPAEKGELLYLVAGPAAASERCQPLLDVMGKKTLSLGDYGQAASMKMLINLLLAQQMLAFSEAVALGKGLGLEEGTMLNVLLATPVTAPFLSAVRPKLENDNYEANFPLKWIQKDLHLATLSAYEQGVAAPSLNLAKEIYAQAKQAGLGDLDFSAMYDFVGR